MNHSQAEVLRIVERAIEMCEQAHPKFNWGASALDAAAITLLNEVPSELQRARQILMNQEFVARIGFRDLAINKGKS